MPLRSLRWFIATLLLVATLACWHAWAMHTHAHRVSQAEQGTGTLDVAHRLIRPEFTADAHLWLHFAERVASGQTWRIRETQVDNAPYGREVHWNNGYIWWLALCGRISAAVTGEPVPRAMESAALWANLPLLLACFAAIGAWVARRYGALAGSLALLALAGHRSFYGGFWPGNADHHGIVIAALVGCALGAVRLFESNDDTLRRRDATWSALWGGVAMWISAATALPLLAGLCLAALVATRFTPPQNIPGIADAWRRWGRIGAGTSLAFYALEYFPDHLGWRLEVNHPLYALAWWAGAEFIAALIDPRRAAESTSAAKIARTTRWALPLAVLPLLVIALWREDVFLPADRLVAGLHGMILEFLPLWHLLPIDGLAGSFEALLVIPAFYGLALWLWRTRTDARATLVFAIVPLAISHVLGIWQARWTGNAIVGMIPLCILIGQNAEFRARFARVIFALTAAAVSLPSLIPRVTGALELAAPDARMAGDDRQLLIRQTAAALRAHAPADQIILWSTPNVAHDLAFYGGFRTLGTLYWENAAGLHAMAEIAAARTDLDAEKLIRARGVTHLAFSPDDDVLDEITRLARPNAPLRDVQQAFATRVFIRDEIPSWLRALPDVAGAGSPNSGRVQLLAVNFSQSEAEAKFYFGEVLARRGAEDRALAAFSRAAELGFAPAALRRAEFLLAAQRWPEAIAALDQALAGAPADARYRLLTQAGTLLARGRQEIAAATFLERALSERVTDTQAANALAWLLATTTEPKLQRRDFALRLAQQSVRLDPSVPSAWSALAAAQAAAGDFTGALRSLDRATIEGGSADPELRSKLAGQREAYAAGRVFRE